MKNRAIVAYQTGPFGSRSFNFKDEWSREDRG